MNAMPSVRSPSAKLGLAILIGFLLSIPLFSIWLMVYDREQQSAEAKAGIAEGWGGPQTIAGPLLVIPYRANVTDTATLLTAMADAGVLRLVASSSAAVYGSAAGGALTEQDRPRPENPYGMTKWVGELKNRRPDRKTAATVVSRKDTP